MTKKLVLPITPTGRRLAADGPIVRGPEDDIDYTVFTSEIMKVEDEAALAERQRILSLFEVRLRAGSMLIGQKHWRNRGLVADEALRELAAALELPAPHLD